MMKMKPVLLVFLIFSVQGIYARQIEGDSTGQKHKHYQEIRAGALFGEENTSLMIHGEYGIRLNRHFGAGVSTGMSRYGNIFTLPVYASFRGYLEEKAKTGFYCYGGIGYGFAWHKNEYEEIYNVEKVLGGMFLQGGFGYLVKLKKSNALTFSLGYVQQGSRTDYSYINSWPTFYLDFAPDSKMEISEKRTIRRFNFSIGFLL